MLCLAVALATHFSGLYQPMHADWSTRLRVARDWRDGAALYRETYCNTQPVVYLWILLIDSSRPERSMYLAESLLAAISATALRAALRRELPRTAAVAPLLLIAWTGVSTTFYGGQITEAPALGFDVLAVSCFALAARKERYWLALLAGACCCLAVFFRIPAIVNCVAWLPIVCIGIRGNPAVRLRKATWLSLSAIIGAVAVLLAIYLHGQWRGYWSDFVAVFSRNLQYGAIDRVPLGASMFEAARTMSRILIQNPTAPVLAIASLAVIISLARRLPRRDRMWLAVALLWLVAAIASAFPGGRHYDHYYHLCWPPLAVLSTMWLDAINRRGGRERNLSKAGMRALRRGLAAGVVAVAVLSNIYAAAKAYRDLHQGTHRWSQISAAVDYLNHTTAAQDPVVMNLWGEWAELYWRSPRPAPSLPIPHVVPRDRFAEWVQATAATPPRMIVADGTAWAPIDGPAEVQSIEQLQLLLGQYREVHRIGELVFLAR